MRVDFAFAQSTPCEPPPLDRAAAGIAVTFTHEEDRLTLVFRREGVLLGERVLDVRDVDCDAMSATARVMVDLTMEELAFAEEEIARASAAQVTFPQIETLPELLVEAVAPEPHERPEPDATLISTTDGARFPEPTTFRLGTTADVGVGLALSSSASVVGSAVIDAAYAPATTGVAPELSGRGGFFTSLPSRSRLDERDVWLSVVASRWDVCGGVRGASFRVRGCAGTILGSMLAEGAESSPLVSVGARLEAAWQATNRTALLLAAEAVSVQLPSEISVIVEEWDYPVTEEVSPISLMFSTGVTGDWLTL